MEHVPTDGEIYQFLMDIKLDNGNGFERTIKKVNEHNISMKTDLTVITSEEVKKISDGVGSFTIVSRDEGFEFITSSHLARIEELKESEETK